MNGDTRDFVQLNPIERRVIFMALEESVLQLQREKEQNPALEAYIQRNIEFRAELMNRFALR